ncbi:hypothetical protein [Salinithrix halophila]|uniref:Minor capsid protein n=1 Tax=Salinithrix halophila TaxID=1485204 RepID=A0ABV8JEK8_9BACL
MDFFDQLKTYIETNFTLYKTPLSVGMLIDDNDICIRQTPGIQPEKDMGDGRHFVYAFQLLTRHKNERLAYQTCEDVALALDLLRNGAIPSADDSYQFVTCNLITPANFVERDSYGGIFTALFEADLYLKGSG